MKEVAEDIRLVQELGAGPPSGPSKPPKPPWQRMGCLAIPAILVLIILIAWVLTSGDSDDPESQPVPSELTADDASSTTSGDSSTTTTTAPDPGASTEAPSKDDLAPGEVLYQGESGDDIGFIAQDGQSRFLSIDGPGVGIGNGAIPSRAITWPTTGRITDFGVTLGSSTNRGRYGINVFLNGQTYAAGCAIEIGQTGCRAKAGDLKASPPITKGDSVTIIIGEQGHADAEGDFPLSWWFTFKPDS